MQNYKKLLKTAAKKKIFFNRVSGKQPAINNKWLYINTLIIALLHEGLTFKPVGLSGNAPAAPNEAFTGRPNE